MKINPSQGTPLGTGYGNNTSSVLKGEKTLAQVSHRLGISAEVLRQANPGLDPNHLRPGQPIELPPAFKHAQGEAQAFAQARGKPAPNVPLGMPRDAKDPKPPRNEVPAAPKSTGAKPELFPKDVLDRKATKAPPAGDPSAPLVDDLSAPSGEVQVAAARLRFEELPEKLQQTLKKSFAHPDEFWAGLGDTQRQTLATIFNRLEGMGLWKHVARVTGEHEQPEKPVGKLKVAGNSGAISFEAYDPKAFTDDLLKSKKFGVDPKVATLFHQGQTSSREYNPTEGSLHISIGPGRHFDAHVDKVGAVDTPTPRPAGRSFIPPAPAITGPRKYCRR